jgi:hypothetical protein
MSTRAQIGFYNSESDKRESFQALIYRHSDGYPGSEKPEDKDYGVLTDIVPFLEWFRDERGLTDLEYVSARLLQYLCNLYDKSSIDYAIATKTRQVNHSPEFTGTLGHGICKEFHGDIAYFYKISPESLQVYHIETKFSADFSKVLSEKFVLIKTIDLRKKGV